MPKTDISVRELIDKVEHGDLTLPEMQRRYVWPATRVRDLLDSLYRGYPSGTILVWETDDNIDSRALAVGTNNSLPTSSQQLLLLDGQQRITSLSAVLAGQPIKVRNRVRPIDIVFNLDHPEGPPVEIYEVDEPDIAVDFSDTEDEESAKRDIKAELKKRTFVVASSILKNDPLWVNVSDIFTKSDAEILRKIGINSDDERWDKYSARLHKVRAIQGYQYVMQVLSKEMPYEEVTEIFVRVNSLGAKLRSSDLALAQITSKWRGFMKLLEDFSEEFGDDAQYIEEWVAIRVLTVFATKQGLYKAINRANKSKLEKSWEEAKRGIHYAVNFLRHNAGIENLSHMSASMLIVPIAVYAVQHDEQLSHEEEKKLLKWFYYAHMRGHYGMGSSEGLLNADLSVLFKNGSLDDLFYVLENHVKKIEVTADDIAGKNTGSPFFSMLYTVLKHDGAKDWFTGLAISDKTTGSTHAIQHHHIFPKSLLQQANIESKQINEIANLAFIGGKTNRKITNKLPKDYLQTEIIDKDREELLPQQFIPMDPIMWEIANYEEFLNYRREQIANAINTFMKNLLEGKDKHAQLTTLDIINNGETDSVEFKGALRYSPKLAGPNPKLELGTLRTIAGFLNNSGGQLYLGVDDHGSITGIESDFNTLGGKKNTDSFENHLNNLIKSSMGAISRKYINIIFESIADKIIAIITVKPCSEPVFVKADNTKQFYVRAGNSTQSLDVEDTIKYIGSNWAK